MAAFDSASDAVRAAVDLQRAAPPPRGGRPEDRRRRGGCAARRRQLAGSADQRGGRPRQPGCGGPDPRDRARARAGRPGRGRLRAAGDDVARRRGRPGRGLRRRLGTRPADGARPAARAVPCGDQRRRRRSPSSAGRTSADSWPRCGRRCRPGSGAPCSSAARRGRARPAWPSSSPGAAPAEGAAVLLGVCDTELAMPYQPWVGVLDQLVRAMPAEVAAASARRAGRRLAARAPARAGDARVAAAARPPTPRPSATACSTRSTPSSPMPPERWPPWW